MPEAPSLPDDWTEPERWAWERIAAGKIADFNEQVQEAGGCAEPLDPKSPDGWGAERRLRAGFLQRILTDPLFVEATPFRGVRILGALLDDKPLDLDYARLQHEFWLGQSRIITAVEALGLRIDGGLSFKESFVAKRIDLNGARIAELLSMNGATFKNVVDLTGARIGLLSMTGACFARRVSLNGATITRSALLDRGATFQNIVDLDKNALDLIGASIGGQLAMKGSRFAGGVSLDGAKIVGPAFLDAGAKFEAKLDLTGASIGADLVLGDTDFASTVNVTNARIGAELRLGSRDQPPARWGSGALILRNTQCASLQDRWPTTKEPGAPAWPSEIDLEGFTYELLGGLAGSGGGGPADMRARPASSYVAWLARHRPFSPQPYEQLAKVLRTSGEPGKANDVLYAARERQRRDYWRAGAWGKWLGMSVLKAAIGYGLGRRYFWALRWVVLFTAIGTLLLMYFGNQPVHDWLTLAFASFDQLLPAITLDRAHDKLFSIATGTAETDSYVQPAWLIIYFYIHKLIGWLLGIFLLAGLAGLTQRS